MPQQQAATARGSGPTRAAWVRLVAALVAAGLGVAVLAVSLARFRELSDARNSPRRSLTVSSCTVDRRTIRTAVTTCHGTVDGVSVRLPDAPRTYSAGTVLTVRCTDDATCTTLTLHHYARPVALLGLGLLTAGAALGFLATRSLDLLAPARAAALRSPRLTRLAHLYCTATALLAAAGYLGHLLT
ncbi:hypothetical protein ACFV1L_11990 [Kitasatospora sp. NPDC059646]|uniref:hypothetical protein n=1 Tax=Kitasatospora sp. NPDC059646 TaxID=3346893 RepID=UPI0036A85086